MSETRDSIRRAASDALLVYDAETNLPIGQIINLSDRGFKLMSEEPVDVPKIYSCRMPALDDIAVKKEITFLAESRWCKHNEETTWYDSGYYLRKISPGDLKIIQTIRRKWMIDQSNKINTPIPETDDKKKGLLAKLFG